MNRELALLAVIRGTLAWAVQQGGNMPTIAAHDLLATIRETAPDTPFAATNDYPEVWP